MLDLPQLYTRPSSTALKSTLELLALKPLPWGSTSQEPPSEGQRQVSEEGVPKYLTSIVASQLDWIDEEEREHVWETASKRLSERSGRTGSFWTFFKVILKV